MHCRPVVHPILAFTLLSSLAACTSTTKDSEVGAGRRQLLLVSQESVLANAQAYYTQEKSEAARKGVLVKGGKDYERLRTILNRLLPATAALRSDAGTWPWELALINEPNTVNAHVLAGGKVTFYTGIIVQTSATDDELAAVMGHEIAHALREHTREKMSQTGAIGAIRSIGLAALGAGPGAQQAAQKAQQLALDLPFSRGMESEADSLGLELAARAGYNPKGAVTLWEKMAKLSSGGSSFTSTHPSSLERRDALEALLPKVIPLYEQALKAPLKPFNVAAATVATTEKPASTGAQVKVAAKSAGRVTEGITCEPKTVHRGDALTITFANTPHPVDIAMTGPEFRRGEGKTYRFIALSGLKDNGLSGLKAASTLVIKADAPLPRFGDAEAPTSRMPSTAFYKAGAYRVLVSTNLETDDGTPLYGSCDITYAP